MDMVIARLSHALSQADQTTSPMLWLERMMVPAAGGGARNSPLSIPVHAGPNIMITRQRKKSFVRRLFMPLLAACFLSYFAYHSFNGSFGVWAMERLEADLARLTAERDRIKAEHAALEARVASVRPGSLDADVIDMKARDALNFMRIDEVVVRYQIQ